MCDYILRTNFAPTFSPKTDLPDSNDTTKLDVREEGDVTVIPRPLLTPGVTTRMDRGLMLQRVIAECFGYKFRHPQILVTAFTHPV